MANSQSTLTLQNILDKVLPLGDVNPVLVNVGGYQLEPFITICTDVMTDICGVEFPHKWNEINLPTFYTNSLQQDYALVNPDGSSFFNVEWLERGICVEVSSTANPLPWGYVECGRQLTQATGSYAQIGMWNNPIFEASTLPNYLLYYGTWGATSPLGTGTLGNNPGPGSVYTDPKLGQTQASNPISQIQDSNGNLLVVTTYGTCGNTAPVLPVNTLPGQTVQDGTTTWTVVDPNGIGIRVLPVPSQTGVTFQFRLVGQMPPKRFKTLDDTLAPFPDKYEPFFRAGVIAQCYRYSITPSVQGKFEKNYQIWLTSLNRLRAVQDRELEENRFTVERGIMGGGIGRNSFPGPFYPFNSPR